MIEFNWGFNMPIEDQANEILRNPGYSNSEIDRLKQDRVIG